MYTYKQYHYNEKIKNNEAKYSNKLKMYKMN